MAQIIKQTPLPKLKLYASTNADYRIFIPITVDSVVPTTLSTYVYQADLRTAKNKSATKVADFTCTATSTGVWLSLTSAVLTGLITGDAEIEKTFYGNLLFRQPDLPTVCFPAAEIEMTVNVGDTQWA
jgi:hypothetical protein